MDEFIHRKTKNKQKLYNNESTNNERISHNNNKKNTSIQAQNSWI